jgi:hypothetical protein
LFDVFQQDVIVDFNLTLEDLRIYNNDNNLVLHEKGHLWSKAFNIDEKTLVAIDSITLEKINMNNDFGYLYLCNHIFSLNSINSWFLQQQDNNELSCPICRQEFTSPRNWNIYSYSDHLARYSILKKIKLYSLINLNGSAICNSTEWKSQFGLKWYQNDILVKKSNVYESNTKLRVPVQFYKFQSQILRCECCNDEKKKDLFQDVMFRDIYTDQWYHLIKNNLTDDTNTIFSNSYEINNNISNYDFEKCNQIKLLLY